MAEVFLVQLAIAAATTFLVYALSPTQRNKGARLSDTRVQTATYGKFIPRLYGTTRMAGNIIWVEDNEIKEAEHTEEVGGKGGGGQEVTTYTYSVSMAVALCDNEILAVSRIWADAILIYDTSQEDAGVLFASDQAASSLTVYTGSLDQQVNPRIQANKPNAPAYRGVAYIVFEDLPLEEFGNRIPNITCEVVKPSDTYEVAGRLHGQILSPGTDLFNDHYPISGGNGIVRWQLSAYNRQPGDTVYVTDIYANLVATEPAPALDLIPLQGFGMLGPPNLPPGRVYVTGNISVQLKYPAVLMWETFNGLFSFDILAFLGLEIQVCSMAFSANDRYLLIVEGETSASPVPSITASQIPEGWYLIAVYGYLEAEIIDTGTVVGDGVGGVFNQQRFGWGKGGDPEFTGGTDNYRTCMENDLKHIWATQSALSGKVHCWEIDDNNVLSSITPDNPKWNGVNDDGVLDYAGGDHTGVWADNGVMMGVSGDGIFTFSRLPISPAPGESLSAVVTDLCANVGIPAADIDVTGLTDTVKGYEITALSSMLANLEFLQLGYLFDIVESEYKLKFVKRGGSSVVTLTEDDLSARERGQEPPDPLLNLREQSVALPKSINLAYYDKDRDYEVFKQYKSRHQ